MVNSKRGDDFDLEALLHPAYAFEHPMRVVNDPDLTLSEKRAIVASWASDACAVEATPALRLVPGAGRAVDFDDIIDALRALDHLAVNTHTPKPHYRKVLQRRKRGIFGRKQQNTDDQGPSLN